MVRKVVWSLVVLVCFVNVLSVRAQTDTPTPSPTPTETATALPTPDVRQMWVQPTTVNELGTPEPWRWVAFAYEANIGDVAILSLLAAIFFVLVALALLWLTRTRKD